MPKEYLDKLKQLEPAQAYRQARFQNATGGQLTHAQSAKDLAAQIEEKTLAMGRSKESTEALSILDKQREDILKAKSKFLKELGGEIDQTKSSLGLSLRTTLEELKSTDKQYTRKLYKGFRNLPNLNMKMDGDLFAESANAAAYNTNASPQFRGSLKKLLRDFNIIQSTKPSPYPKGDFTINNADRIINEINKLPINKTYEGSDIAAKQMIKENFESMFEITARDSNIKAVQELEKEARSSAWQNRLKWNDRDILTDLLKYKNGTQSYVIPESDILNTIYRGGDKKLEKIKKIKNVLMINPTSKSEEVWKNIKTQGTLDIFSKSIFKSAEGKTYISGNDLNKAIEEFGEEPLKALLDRNEYRVLKQLQNAIGDATIDVDGKQLKKGMPKVIDLLAKLTFLQSVPLLYKGAHLLNNSIDSAISYMDKSTILNGMKNGYRNLPAKDAAKLYIDFAIQNSLLRGGIQTGQYLSEDQQ